MHNKSTDVLQNELKKSKDVASFIKDNSKQMKPTSVSDYLTEMMIRYNIEKSELITRTNISPSYAYQILDGRKKPSRDKLCQFALGFPLTLEETNNLLRCGGYNELYVRCKRDVLIQFALQKNYNVLQASELLVQNGEDAF